MTPLGHPQNFNRPVATPFARIVERLKPGATGRDIVALLDGKVQRTVALNWRSGRRPAPQWAIDRLHQRWHQVESDARADLAAMQPGPGTKAGALNIRRYNARRV